MPNFSSFRSEFLEEPTLSRTCIEYTEFKQKRIKRPQTLRVRGYANKTQQPDYDTYVVEIKDVLYFIPATSVQDNSAINAENEYLARQLDSLTLSFEQARIEYENESQSLLKAYTDSLQKYKNIKFSIPLTIKILEQNIEDDFKAIEDEEHLDWYNGLSASAKNTYDNILTFSGGYLSSPNSAGGCDYILKFKNKSNKTIKYVHFTIVFYNAVDDRVKCEIRRSSSLSCQDTGPVYPEAWGGGTWDCVIYNYSANYAKLTNLLIIYMDGSSTYVSDKDVTQLLTEPDFWGGPPKAIKKYGGSLEYAKRKATAPYEKQLQNIDKDIEKWKRRIYDIKTEYYIGYDGDDEHRTKFRNLSSLNKRFRETEKAFYRFQRNNFYL